MSAANAVEEMMSLKKNRSLQKLLQKYPDFRDLDSSFNSLTGPTHSSLEPRSTLLGVSLSSSHARESRELSRISGLPTTDSLVPEDDEDDPVDDRDEDCDNNQYDCCRRSETEFGSLLTRLGERNLDTLLQSQAKVSKWLKSTRRSKSSVPKSTKRSKISRQLPDDQSAKKSKKIVPPGKCQVTVSGKLCGTVVSSECDICGKHVCKAHRTVTINCPNYLESIKDCFKDLGKPVDSLCFDEVDKPNIKGGMGRCVCFSGGKKRKVSRTRCQTCRRYICAEHQVKTIRCEAHRFHSLTPGLDSDYESSSVNSDRSGIVDHIDTI
ncbi:unnamed protein product [Allacma fusca]|uniref:Uncharacterized protein n=1 Tax=Allacma fusca TaxID=39272 RepID=A0A8J2PNP2_9HEXA|nr:unnamed protein product [Allacma fusca]